jgi:hypothetical protein
MLLVLELVLDVVLLPADEILVPTEVVVDLAVIAIPFIADALATRSSGRKIGGRWGAGKRRGSAGVFGLVVVWGVVGALLLVEWYLSVHHPILSLLTALVWVPFDLLVVGVAILFSLWVAVDGVRARRSRQVGQ